MTVKSRKSKPPPSPPLREPSEAERKVIANAATEQGKRDRRAELKIAHEGRAVSVSQPHSDGRGWSDMMRETFGTTSADFCNIALSRIELVLRDKGEAYMTEARANALLALIGAIAPRDELEASVAGQIAAADALSMDLMSRAKHADTLEKLQAFTNLATKVSRTMAAHIETLTRLRSGGKQQVIVKHVYVQGNAVVGDHAQAVIGADPGGVLNVISHQPHEPGLPALPKPPLRGQDAGWDALPIGGDEGEGPMRPARREEPGSAEGQGEWPVHLRAVDAGTSRRATPGPRRAARNGGD